MDPLTSGVSHRLHALAAPLTFVCALAASAALMHTPAQAHGEGGMDGPGADAGAHWGLGIAAVPEVKPYRGVESKTEVWPLLTFENRWLRLMGPGLELKLGSTGPVSYGLTAGYARDGYKASEAPALQGMATRHASAWLGARLGLRTEWGQFSADWSADASDHSRGQKLKLGAEHRFAFGPVGLTPRVTATWLDRKVVRYYYGVDAAEARAGRAAYSPGGTVNTEAGLRLDFRLAPDQAAFVDLGATALGGAIRNSPLVDRRALPEVRIGYLFRF